MQCTKSPGTCCVTLKSIDTSEYFCFKVLQIPRVHQYWDPKSPQNLIPEVLQNNVTLGSLCSVSSYYMYTFLCRIVAGWQDRAPDHTEWQGLPTQFSPWFSAPRQEQQPAKHGSWPAWQNTSTLEGSRLLLLLSGEQDCFPCFRWTPMMNISLSLPFLMTLNLGITALPRDAGGRRDPPKQPSLWPRWSCVCKKGAGRTKPGILEQAMLFGTVNMTTARSHPKYMWQVQCPETSSTRCAPLCSQNFPQSPNFCMFVRM